MIRLKAKKRVFQILVELPVDKKIDFILSLISLILRFENKENVSKICFTHDMVSK